MPENNEYTGERLSFFEIFSQKKYKLVIPIIQRDYAQGRTNDDVLEVRTEFLEVLYTYLEENRPFRDLDFVYGTLQEDKDDKLVHFIPLDGQQRLTTLFLLHWFLYQISKNEEAKTTFKKWMIRGNNSMFTYQTRQSATDFCDALMRATINMEQPLRIKGEDNEDMASLSDRIKNEPWFFRFWKNDPTIQSMLVMLDTICHKFSGHPEFFERLLNAKNPIITFIFMDLKRYKLTDDLYIKMNARGKPLTKFENFKAKFEQHLRQLEEDEEINRKWVLKFAGKEKAVSLHQYFSFNIDTKWTSLLWQYCKDGKQHNLDSYIENLFRVIVTNHYASIVKLQNRKTSDDTFDTLTGKVGSLTFTKYKEAKVLDSEAVLSVVDSFDALYNGTEKIAKNISKSYKKYFDEAEIFEKVIVNKLNMAERMQFYAYVQYLILHKDKLEGLNEWMRVVHNLTHPDNTNIDGNDDMARGIKSIKKLLPYAPNIIKYLQGVTTIEGFSKHQSVEECIKAHLVEKPEWKELVQDIELHNYFNGQIGFILEFSGICDYYQVNNNLNWNEVEDEKFKEVFTRYAKISKYIFELDKDNKTRIHNKRYCFERAVLAHGNYLLERIGYSNLLSTETVQQNVKRDLSWKRVLRMGDEQMQNGKNLIKATFDAISNPDDITESLEKLCIPKTEDKWRNVLIASPNLIDECKKGFICWDRDGIFLLREWYLSHYHAELFTYHLWCTKFEDEKVVFEGFEKKYEWQKCSTIIPHISIKNFSYEDNKYSIKIYSVLNKKGDFFKYQIRFGFDDENKFDYPDKIIESIEDLHFKKEDKNGNWYSYDCVYEETMNDTEKSVFNTVSNLLVHLKNVTLFA